jgi:hypothetical protein
VNVAKLVAIPDDLRIRIADLVKFAEEDGRVEALAAVDRHLQREGEASPYPEIRQFCRELRMMFERNEFRILIPRGRDSDKVGGAPE